MFRQIKSFVLVAIAVGVVMGGSAPALAQKQTSYTELYRNDTPNAARCLKKYVGNYTVVKATSSIGPCPVTHVGNYSVITCADGPVAPGVGTVWVTAYGTSASSKAEVLCAKWYSNTACTAFIGYATPVASVTATTTESNLTVTVEHAAQEVNDTTGAPGPALGTIYGRDVQYAITDYFRPLEELNEDLFTSITWTDMDDCDFELATLEDTDSCDLGAHDDPAVLLFRFYTGASGTDTYELVQFCMIGTCIPAVSQWGMLVIALLLAAGGTIVIRRRRAMAT